MACPQGASGTHWDGRRTGFLPPYGSRHLIGITSFQRARAAPTASTTCSGCATSAASTRRTWTGWSSSTEYARSLGIDPNENQKPWQQWMLNRANNGLGACVVSTGLGLLDG